MLWQVVTTDYFSVQLNGQETKVINIKIIATINLFIVQAPVYIRGVVKFGKAVVTGTLKNGKKPPVIKKPTLRKTDGLIKGQQTKITGR